MILVHWKPCFYAVALVLSGFPPPPPPLLIWLFYWMLLTIIAELSNLKIYKVNKLTLAACGQSLNHWTQYRIIHT